MNTETKNTILSLADHAQRLERRNELLEAQTAVIEVFAAALGLRSHGGAMQECPIHKARKLVEHSEMMDKMKGPEASE